MVFALSYDKQQNKEKNKMAKRRKITETIRFEWIAVQKKGPWGRGIRGGSENVKKVVRLECGHVTRVGEGAMYGLCYKCQEV